MEVDMEAENKHPPVFLHGQRVRILDSAQLDGSPHPCAGLEAVIRSNDYDGYVQVRLVSPYASRIWLWDIKADQLILAEK